MREKTLYQMGVDINNDWTFLNGDLKTKKYDKNIHQAVSNRLTCALGALSIFYGDEYGSKITDYIGKKNIESTHEYIRLEIEKRIILDPRFKHIECVVNKFNFEIVDVDLTITFLNGDVYEDNFVIGIGEING